MAQPVDVSDGEDFGAGLVATEGSGPEDCELSDSNASMDESVELLCVGCEVSSKADCPIAVKKKVPPPRPRVVWGKQTSRKVKTKTGRKVDKTKVRCGEWCANCMNGQKRILRNDKKYKALAAKHGKKYAGKVLRDEVAAGGQMTERFHKMIKEDIHQKAGGKSRVRGSGETVTRVSSEKLRIEPGKGHFYTVDRYSREFGDPMKNGATVVDHQRLGRGVLVMEDCDGKFPLQQLMDDEVAHAKPVHDGKDVLEDDEMENCQANEAEELEAMVKGAMTVSQTMEKAAAVKQSALEQARLTAQTAKQQEKKLESDSDEEKSGSNSSSSSSEDDDSSDDDKKNRWPEGRNLFENLATNKRAPLNLNVNGLIMNVQLLLGPAGPCDL